jgi:predicted Abi (CAAX) family protease
MVVMANLPDGGVAVIKVWKDADGKLQAGWGPIRSVIPATVERAK